MPQIRQFAVRWGPAILWMVVLFSASGTQSRDIPNFGSIDYFVKKTGHILGYAVLALLFRRALGGEDRRGWLAWALAVAYALTDEFHQSFVPGRHPALLDVLWFDGGGAALALWLTALFQRHRRLE